jgi:ketosteroid isomerase-like protein
MKNQQCIEASPLRSFIDEYFEAWRESVAENLLGYFTEDVVINLWGDGGTLTGKKMVGERWVIPMIKNYAGNNHHVENFIELGDQVAVEWCFTGIHAITGKEINIQGCSIYWVSRGLIRRGHVYFNSPQAKRDQGLSALDHTHHSGRLGQARQQAPSNL